MTEGAANNSRGLESRWDVAALRAGAGVCLLIAVPLTVIAAIVDSDDGGVQALFFFGAMAGFVVGGGCAAWVERRVQPWLSCRAGWDLLQRDYEEAAPGFRRSRFEIQLLASSRSHP